MINPELKQQLITWRRDFHRHAESGWTELRTSSLIAAHLDSLGFQVKLGKEVLCLDSIMGRDEAGIPAQMDRAAAQGANPLWLERTGGYTGVMGILDTGRPGPVVALRFDIDANDVSESQQPNHRPFAEGFASINPRGMHACGHDGHTAIGLGVASLLAKEKDSLCGRIKLLFQPAEEGVRGGKAMADSGIVDDVDVLLGCHLGMGLPVGTVYTSTKGFLSSTKMDVSYTGKSAHAGVEPNAGHNALLAACAATMMLHAIPPHREGPTRINVGVLNAGLGRNVIAPNAELKLETRGYSGALNQYMQDNAVKILENTAATYGVSCQINTVGSSTDCICDEEISALARSCAEQMDSVTKISELADMGGSEDITWLIRAVQRRGGKGTYMLVGSEIAAGHHNEYFDFNEDVLPLAAELLTRSVVTLLKHQF